jgi:hypothetical protein
MTRSTNRPTRSSTSMRMSAARDFRPRQRESGRVVGQPARTATAYVPPVQMNGSKDTPEFHSAGSIAADRSCAA